MDKKHRFNVNKREERLKAKEEAKNPKKDDKTGENKGDATVGGTENPTT